MKAGARGRLRRVGVGVGVAISGFAAWVLWPTKDSEPTPVPVERASERARIERTPTAVTRPPSEARTQVDKTEKEGSQADHARKEWHAITPELQRIRHENDLIRKLNDAMALGDFITLRKVLATYRETHPEDEYALQEGYELIADCLEFPGSETKARGLQYWKDNRASTLRRFVRRHCGFAYKDVVGDGQSER